jgi:hypothetical protein
VYRYPEATALKVLRVILAPMVEVTTGLASIPDCRDAEHPGPAMRLVFVGGVKSKKPA